MALPIDATDTLGRTLTYAWTATCPGLPSSGSFTPGPTVESPTWVAPVNKTGSPQTCTLQVVVSDGQGQSQTRTFTQVVDSVPQEITFTSPASGTPNPVVSEGTVTVSVVADDALDRTLTYAWTAICPGLPSSGLFTSPASASSTWTAPANLTGTPQTCTITVTVGDGHGFTRSSSYQQVVTSAPQIVGSPIGSNDNPNGVAPGTGIDLGVVGGGTPGQPLSYLWSASCPGSTPTARSMRRPAPRRAGPPR